MSIIDTNGKPVVTTDANVPLGRPARREKNWHAHNQAGRYLPGEKTITVRMPRALHQELRKKAREQGMSLNTLCTNLLADYLERQPTKTLPATEPAK